MKNQKIKSSTCGDSSLKVFIIVVCILAITASVMAIFASFEKNRNFHRQADTIRLNSQNNSTAGSTLGIANPASVNCLNSGGSLDIRQDENGGQYGICVFNDQSECDEWKLFRNECKMGDSLKK